MIRFEARAMLDAISSDVERSRRSDALAHFASYVSLLREATSRVSGGETTRRDDGYWLKLEAADGRWTVDYRPLPRPPRIGEVLELAPASRWQVKRLQSVKPPRADAPLREYLVCAPAA